MASSGKRLHRRQFLRDGAVLSSVGLAAPTWSSLACATEQSGKPGGTLKFADNTAWVSLDPHGAPNGSSLRLISLVYSYLLAVDAEGDLKTDLVESWEMTTPTLLEFTLRKNVHFHNGRLLTAEDVKYSIERMIDPKTGMSVRTYYLSIRDVEVINPTQFRLHLRQPDAALPIHLASPRAAIVAREVVEQHGDLGDPRHMGGSGPFRFDSQSVSGTITLARNEKYYVEDRPYLARLDMSVIQNDNARLNGLRAGDVDMINFVPPNQIQSLAKSRALTVGPGYSGQYYYLYMNMRRKPWDNLQLRQALMYAVDRDVLLHAAIFDQGVALKGGPIPSWNKWALKGDLYPAPDLERARRLLGQTPYASGIKATIGIFSGQAFAVLAAQILQSQLAALNITLEIRQFGDYASYNTAVFVKGDLDLTIQGNGNNVDPDDWLSTFFQSTSPQNYVRYHDAKVDALLQKGREETEFGRRKAIYDEVQTILATNGPMVFLWNMYQPEAWTSGVRGYKHRVDLMTSGLVDAWKS